jgi:ThiF family protein
MFENPDQMRRRIASRWPSADAFYAERDDRTVRVIKDLYAYADRPVEIVVDPTFASDLTVQRIALVAANLTTRWGRHVRVVMPLGAPLHADLRRDGLTTLAERVQREIVMADPFGDFKVVDASESAAEGALRLFIGPWVQRPLVSEPEDYFVHACGWTAMARRAGIITRLSDSDVIAGTVAAGGLAGALGAADLFKRAIGHGRSTWMPTFSWDTWSSRLRLGASAWSSIEKRPAPTTLDFERALLAGVGAIGSAFIYLADMMPIAGALTFLDRDNIEITNLNRSPLFDILHVLDESPKTDAAAAYLVRHGLQLSRVQGLWREHAPRLGAAPFDVWISLTNEDGAWAEVPFQLPPLVLHGTTTSGWGFGAGRHIPRVEDCTLCRMPRPATEFRGPCAEGEVAPAVAGNPVRASLPFLSTASAALVLAFYLQLQSGGPVRELVNDISVDLGVGLPVVLGLTRQPTVGCRGCQALQSAAWLKRGGRGRFAELSLSSGLV